MPTHDRRRSLARKASEPVLLDISETCSGVVQGGPLGINRGRSLNRSRSLLRQASIRSIHSTETSVPKARKITFASDVFQPQHKPPSVRLDVWNPEDIDIGISVPMRAFLKNDHNASSCQPLRKTKPKKQQTMPKLEKRLHRVTTRHTEEVLELKVLRDKANELQVENDEAEEEVTKRDLMTANHIRITELINELERAEKKLTAKIRSCYEKIDSVKKETKKLSLVLRQSKKKLQRSKLQRTVAMPHIPRQQSDNQYSYHFSNRPILL